MNYYPFHLGDYATATRHLSWDEDAAYRRLLDAYYTHEKPLPIELRAVFRLVIATTESQREAVETVLREFFSLTDIGWVNKRADAELEAMREKQRKQREKANRRWDMQRTARGTTAAQEDHAAAQNSHADAMPPTPTPISSEAIASDGKPSVDNSKPKADRAKADLWKAAVGVLAQGGCENEAMSRSFMGKLVKDYGLEAVRIAVDSAVSVQPADAREYLKATCQRNAGERKDPVTVPSDEPEKTAAMLEAQRMTPEQRAASEAARRKVMAMVKGVVQ